MAVRRAHRVTGGAPSEGDHHPSLVDELEQVQRVVDRTGGFGRGDDRAQRAQSQPDTHDRATAVDEQPGRLRRTDPHADTLAPACPSDGVGDARSDVAKLSVAGVPEPGQSWVGGGREVRVGREDHDMVARHAEKRGEHGTQGAAVERVDGHHVDRRVEGPAREAEHVGLERLGDRVRGRELVGIAGRAHRREVSRGDVDARHEHRRTVV